MSTTIEKPREAGPDSGLGGEWRVIVRNDNHNTFDHVAETLARVLPGVSLDQGHRIAEVTDAAAGFLQGRAAGFSLGAVGNAKGAVGSFDDVVVRVPSPY